MTPTQPPAFLTSGAARLESRLPRVVHGLRRMRDRSLRWRDSFAYRSYPDPGKPFGARYLRNHRKFIVQTLSDRGDAARSATESAPRAATAWGWTSARWSSHG